MFPFTSYISSQLCHMLFPLSMKCAHPPPSSTTYGEDGLCCSSSAIQTWLGPSSLLEERSEIPIVLLFVLSATPQTGGNSQGI